MAVRKVNRKKPWQCYWTNPFTAKQESAQFDTEREAQAHDSLIKHRLRFERESFRPEDEPDIIEKEMTVEELLFAYLAHRRPKKDNARKALSAIRPVAEVLGRTTLTQISKAQIAAAIREQGQTVSPKTVRVRFAHLKAALNWAVEQGLLATAPVIKLPRATPKIIPPPTIEESAAIFSNAAPHLQRVILLGTFCGVRIGPSELFKLTWGDVNFHQRVLRVWSADKNANIPWRDVPIHDELFDKMLEWHRQDGGAGYIINFRGKQVTTVKRAWATALAGAGITRRIRPYDLRHAFATNALAAGADLKSVSEIMGHADTTMVLKTYQHVQDSQRKQAIKILPSILQNPEQKT